MVHQDPYASLNPVQTVYATLAALAVLTEPGRAERVVSVLTMLMGLLFIGLIVVLVRRTRL
jgi:ABC-type dipeptide/oligopeptide/nickel transport system ATPase subunit